MWTEYCVYKSTSESFCFPNAEDTIICAKYELREWLKNDTIISWRKVWKKVNNELKRKILNKLELSFSYTRCAGELWAALWWRLCFSCQIKFPWGCWKQPPSSFPTYTTLSLSAFPLSTWGMARAIIKRTLRREIQKFSLIYHYLLAALVMTEEKTRFF